MTNPQFTTPAPDAATPDQDATGAAGGGREIDRTWDRLHQDDKDRDGGPGGAIDDPSGGDGQPEGGRLPHHRDLPGQEIPDQDPDLEPTIGDDGEENPDAFPTDRQKGGRSTPV